MKHVRLIRHGESAANAGEASVDHASIPLTARGMAQAQLVALWFDIAPGLIVASPYLRAQATALETASAFPSATFETWPIHEYTYLEPARCANTTVVQRRNWVEAYWAKSDPAFRDGIGAESFIEFISRAQSFLDRLAEHPSQDIVVFSHGQYINAVVWLIERKPQKIDGRAMADWRAYEIANHVPNCSGYTLSKNHNDAVWKLSVAEPQIDVIQRVEGIAYQAARDPELPLVEERAGTLSAARSWQAGDVEEHTIAELSAREISQMLREVVFGRSLMSKVGQESWDEIYAGHFLVNVEGWRISIYNDCDTLDYCEECVSPEGQRWSFGAGDRFGTDPIALLSTWEHQTLEHLLKAL